MHACYYLANEIGINLQPCAHHMPVRQLYFPLWSKPVAQIEGHALGWDKDA